MNDRRDRPVGPPIGSEELEAFYARQRHQILGRLAEAAPAGRLLRLPARAWLGLGLAAAAALVLTFVAFQDPEVIDPGAGELVVGPAPDELASMPARLSAFGVWSDADVEMEPAAGVEMETLAWLMSEETAGTTGVVPSFLEPFGTWAAEDAAAEETT